VKRGKPLKRKKPLAPGKASLNPGKGLKRTEFKRKPPTGPQKTPRSPKPAESPALRRARAEWQRMASRGQCAMCGTWGGCEGHHIVPLGDMKIAGVPEEHWYDHERNMLRLCGAFTDRNCHARHENWIVRVRLATLVASTPKVFEFADEIGMRWRLDLEYR
jgi:hypothetical protein